MACEAPVFFSITTDQDRGPLKVVFSAGGTGGHVFPAIALADALKALHPSCCISFVGTKHRLEASAVPLAGYPFHPIQAVALIRPVFSLSNLLLPFRITASLCLALILIFRLRPHVVVGTGGYVSAPLCLAAALTGCPFVIQEQNAYAGMTNKVFSRFATIIFVAFSAAIRHFPSRKCILCGNPVRSSLQHPIPKGQALQQFFENWHLLCTNEYDTKSKQQQHRVSAMDGSKEPISPEVILILGGSLGAKSINVAMSELVLQMLDHWPHRFIIWQTGSKHYKEVIKKTGKHKRLFISE